MSPEPLPELDEVRGAISALEAARTEVRRAINAASAAGATQREIAAVAGVSQGKVWRILSGRE